MMKAEAAERTPPSISLRKRPRGGGSQSQTNSSWAAQDENSEIISLITNTAENSPKWRGRSITAGGVGDSNHAPERNDTIYGYYYDDTNEYSFDCTFGTEETDGIWMQRNDPPGTILSAFVWVFDVFGMNRNITWLLPTEPLLPDYDRVVGFSMPQRLLREGGDNTSMC